MRRRGSLLAAATIAGLLASFGAAPAYADEVVDESIVEETVPVEEVPVEEPPVEEEPEEEPPVVEEPPAEEPPVAEPPVVEEPPASAPVAVADVLFDWGLNEESSGGAYFGGCNFLSAGVAGDTGSSRLWTQADGFFRATDGRTTIVKPDAASDLVASTWATKCQAADGSSVNGRTNAQAENDHTASRVQIAGGAGTVDPVAGTADISWDGAFTVVYYGGMTYWSATDPRLVVAADGTGTVTASLSGYAADINDPSIWGAVPARDVVLAEFSGVTVTADGLEAMPAYLGVAIPDDVAGRNAQAIPSDANAAWWGAFPADFLRFQQLTGQSSYWYTTEGPATSIQPRKVALPLSAIVGATTPVPAAPAIVTQPADASAAAGTVATFAVEATGTDLVYAWESLDRSGEWTPIEGAIEAALQVDATADIDGTGYRVVVSNDLGSVVSERATLTIVGSGGGGSDPQEPVRADGAVFDWGLNNESNGGAYFGGCNFLSAGTAGDAGSARLWTATDGLYRAADGNTTIVRPTADGSGITAASWETRCQTPSGASVNGKSTAAGDSYTQSRVRITGGTGTIDPEAGTAALSWTGSFTVAYYGGMTYWSAADPRLVVNADGTGTVTVTASGYGSDMDDTSKWSALAPRDVVIATFSGVEVTAAGLTATPDFLGVSIPADVAGRNAQAERTDANAAWWGAFPADFVRFQTETGQSAYWWTTEGSRSSIQPRKVPLPITVCATADCTVPAQAQTDAPASIDLRQRALRAPNGIPAPTLETVTAVVQDAAQHVVVVQRAAAVAVSEAVDRRLVLAAIALLAALGLLVVVTAAGAGVVLRLRR